MMKFFYMVDQDVDFNFGFYVYSSIYHILVETFFSKKKVLENISGISSKTLSKVKPPRHHIVCQILDDQ